MPTEHYSIAGHGLPDVSAVLLMSACLAAAFVLLLMIIARPPRWPAMTATISARPWYLDHVGLLIATALCGISTLRLFVWLTGKLEWQSIPPYAWLAMGTAFVHLPLLAVIWLVTKLEHISLKSGFGVEPGGALRRVVVGVFLAMGTYPLVALLAALYSWFLMQMELQCNPQQVVMMIKDATGAPWYVNISVGVIAVILVPSIEELVFRGIAFPAAARRLGILPAAIIISLIFAVMHLEIATYVPLFVLSMALCLAYAHSGSMLVPFALHATFNLIQVAFLPFSQLE